MGQPLVALGILVLLWIGAVDAVHVGGLEHGLGADLGGAQDRGGVGGKERIAGAAREQHEPLLREVPHALDARS